MKGGRLDIGRAYGHGVQWLAPAGIMMVMIQGFDGVSSSNFFQHTSSAPK